MESNLHDQAITPVSWIVIVGVMILATIRAVDMTIVNVALPHMMGSLASSKDQITWIMTSYMTATAVVTPLLGFVAEKFGRRRTILVSGIGFTIASFGCGVATNMFIMILFRVLQGAFGAALNPLAQSILMDSFPKRQSRIAMSIYGFGVITAPIFGPLLGAYLTEYFSWQWMFFINVPICSIGIFICYKYLPETTKKAITLNWFDIILIIIGIGAFQIVIDRGNQEDWFQSSVIQLLVLISIIFSICYALRQIKAKNPLINYALFKDRTFCIAFFATIVFFLAMMGKIVAFPLMLSELFGYPIIENAWVLVPLGMASMVGMLISANLMKKIDSKLLLISGALLGIFSSIYTANFNLTAGNESFIFPNILQGLSIGLFFTPLSSVSYAHLPESVIDQASAMLNFARNLGSSIGIAIVSTIVYRGVQINWQRLITNTTIYNKNFIGWTERFNIHLNNAAHAKYMAKYVLQQATMMAYNEAYLFTAICFCLLIPMVLLLGKTKL